MRQLVATPAMSRLDCPLLDTAIASLSARNRATSPVRASCALRFTSGRADGPEHPGLLTTDYGEPGDRLLRRPATLCDRVVTAHSLPGTMTSSSRRRGSGIGWGP